MATLTYTMEEILSPDPNFPDGYIAQGPFAIQAFDFGRNWFYMPISGSGSASDVGGMAVTDLTTMQVIRTVTMAQMYAGTAWSPPSQAIYQCTAGNNTNLYILTAGTGALPSEWARFTRVDPVTMKVTGEFYVTTGFPPPINNVGSGGWQGGLINTTATHEIVLYPINGAISATGCEIFDGTTMTPIGLGPTPMNTNYNVMYCAGKKYPDGSCDFIMMDPDSWTVPPTGNIDIWRIHVSDSLVITNTKTGTLNVLSLFTPPNTTENVFVGQLEYDPIHDTMIVTTPDTAASGTGTPSGTPSWLLSVNYDGTVNWSTYQPTIGGSIYNNSQYQLAGGTYMAGNSDNLHLYDTATGALLYTGSILVGGTSAGSFYHVWDSERNAYWTYALARGFVRIDFVTSELLMDNLLVSGGPKTSELIFLDWSDDRGHSYGNPVGQLIGARGAYRTSPQWQRLAYARDRCFRLTWSVPVATTLQGAWIDVDSSSKT